MENKDLKKIAEQILKLEQECEKGNNISENMSKMASLIEKYSPEEVLQIDNYIMENILTK